MTGIEVGQGIDSFQESSEERTELAVGHDQHQGQVQIETELDVSDEKKMIILPRIVQTW